MSADRARMRAKPHPRQRWIDAAVTVVVTFAGLGAALITNIDPHRLDPRAVGLRTYALGIALALLGGLPLAVRRRWPLAVLGAVEAAVVIHSIAISANPRAAGAEHGGGRSNRVRCAIQAARCLGLGVARPAA